MSRPTIAPAATLRGWPRFPLRAVFRAPICSLSTTSARPLTPALTSEPALALSYLGGGGHPGLRAWIGARHGVPAERVVASNGSLQAFLFLSEILVERSSTKRVLVEAPTYDRPLILLRRAGAEPVGIPVDEHGLDVDALEDDLRRAGAPAFLYVIPTFQNPSGSTLPFERRERLVELSHRFGFPIVEDDPYGLLRFRGDTLPTIHSLDPIV